MQESQDTLYLYDPARMEQKSPFQKYMEKFSKPIKEKNLKQQQQQLQLEDEDDCEDENEEIQNTSGSGVALQKTIKKDKRKYIKAFQKSKNSSSEELAQISNLRQCSFVVPRNISQMFCFLFTGFVPIEVTDEEDQQRISDQHIKCESLLKEKHFFTSNNFVVQIDKEFNLAIHLLEGKQDCNDYQFAQMLRQYQSLVHTQTDFLREIKKTLGPDEHYVNDFLKQREIYREEYLCKYIAENMKEDDYYICCDIDIHQNDFVTCPSTMKISKNLFTLFGIEEDEVNTFITKRNGFPEMFPHYSRRMLSISSLSQKLQGDINSSVFMRQFEFNTVDGIRLFFDILSVKCPIQYPLNLQFPNYSYLPYGLEQLQIFKLFISEKQIQQVFAQRHNNTQSSSQQPSKIFEDFEYSMVSSIFIEKFYPVEYRNQFGGFQNVEKTPPNEEEQVDAHKICKYKSIVQDQPKV